MATNGSLVHAAVPISLDGRQFVLRYRALAFIRYAEETGGDLLADIRNLGEIGEAIQAGGQAPSAGGGMFGKLRDIVWAGLLDQQPETTRDETARLFGLEDLPELMPAIAAALRGTLPEGTATARPTKRPRGRPPICPLPRDPGPLTDGSASGPSSAMDQESAPKNSAA